MASSSDSGVNIEGDDAPSDLYVAGEWIINNFSQRISSPALKCEIFDIDGLKWRIQIIKVHDNICPCLCLVDTVESGFIRYAHCTMAVYKDLDRVSQKGLFCEFGDKKKFVQWSDFCKVSDALTADDSLTLRYQVQVVKFRDDRSCFIRPEYRAELSRHHYLKLEERFKDAISNQLCVAVSEFIPGEGEEDLLDRLASSWDRQSQDWKRKYISDEQIQNQFPYFAHSLWIDSKNTETMLLVDVCYEILWTKKLNQDDVSINMESYNLPMLVYKAINDTHPLVRDDNSELASLTAAERMKHLGYKYFDLFTLCNHLSKCVNDGFPTTGGSPHITSSGGESVQPSPPGLTPVGEQQTTSPGGESVQPSSPGLTPMGEQQTTSSDVSESVQPSDVSEQQTTSSDVSEFVQPSLVGESVQPSDVSEPVPRGLMDFQLSGELIINRSSSVSCECNNEGCRVPHLHTTVEWIIEGFSKSIRQNWISHVFLLDGFEWYFLFQHTGGNPCKIFLCVFDHMSLQGGRSRYVQFTHSMSRDGKECERKDSFHEFSNNNLKAGWEVEEADVSGEDGIVTLRFEMQVIWRESVEDLWHCLVRSYRCDLLLRHEAEVVEYFQKKIIRYKNEMVAAVYNEAWWLSFNQYWMYAYPSARELMSRIQMPPVLEREIWRRFGGLQGFPALYLDCFYKALEHFGPVIREENGVFVLDDHNLPSAMYKATRKIEYPLQFPQDDTRFDDVVKWGAAFVETFTIYKLFRVAEAFHRRYILSQPPIDPVPLLPRRETLKPPSDPVLARYVDYDYGSD